MGVQIPAKTETGRSEDAEKRSKMGGGGGEWMSYLFVYRMIIAYHLISSEAEGRRGSGIRSRSLSRTTVQLHRIADWM